MIWLLQVEINCTSHHRYYEQQAGTRVLQASQEGVYTAKFLPCIPGRWSHHVLCSATDLARQRDCFSNSMHSGVCYDSLAPVLKRDRDRDPEDYFNSLIGMRNRTGVKDDWSFKSGSTAALYSALSVQDGGAGRQLNKNGPGGGGLRLTGRGLSCGIHSIQTNISSACEQISINKLGGFTFYTWPLG